MDSLLFLIKKHNNKTVGYNDKLTNSLHNIYQQKRIRRGMA